MKIGIVCKEIQISPSFAEGTDVMIYEIDRAHEIVSKECIPVEGQGHIPVSGVMIKNSVNGVICGSIGKNAFTMMQNLRAHVFTDISGDPDEAIAKLLRRELTELKKIDCDHLEEETGCNGDCASCAYH